MNEVKFIMLVKKLEEVAEHFDDFYEFIDKWVEKNHSDRETAHLTGIAGFRQDGIEYNWGRSGCSRGCCGYHTGEDLVTFDELLAFAQEQNNG